MSFYAPRRQYGFLPLITAAMPLLQGAFTSQPVDTSNPYAAQERGNPTLTIALAVGGLALVGGAFYFVLRGRR